MGNQAKALLKEALSLSEKERADLAGALLQSIEPPEELGIEDAWRQEVAARMKALKAGEVETIPWDRVRDRLHERLRAKSQD